jgi:hypothetical protein
MSMIYQLRGAPEAANPDEWRITYLHTPKQHGRKKKQLGVVVDETVLVELRVTGSRGEEKDEARRRAVLWDKRYHLYAVLEASEWAAADLLPLRLEQSHSEEVAAGRGALAKLVQGEIEGLAESCGVDVSVVRHGPRPRVRATTRCDNLKLKSV